MFVGMGKSKRKTRQDYKDGRKEVEGKKSKKGKGKAPLPRSEDTARMDRLYREENERMRAAIRSSMKDAGVSMGKVYRAMADTSDSDEEEFLDRAVAEAREMSPLCLAAEAEEAALEEEEEDEERETGVETGQEEETGEEGETGDEEGDSAGPSTQPLPKQPKKKKGKKVVDPESDNDPDPPSAYQEDHAPDEEGWSRCLEEINVRGFKGKKRGPSFKKKKSPLQYFLKFFPLALFISMVKWTNTKLRANRQRLTNLQELKAWFAIHILMGLVKIGNYKHYWSSHPGLRNTLISTTMKRNRFDVISQHLACNDPAKDPDLIRDKAHRYLTKRRRPLYPLQPLWDKVRRRCLKNYRPARELAIDEAMIKYKGFKASVRKFFMPLKPIRAGFKIYAIAEAATGFFSNFIIHPHGEKPAKMVDIAMDVAKHHLGQYHHIFSDKLYTSVSLARLLHSKKTYLTGAVKSNSKGLPRDFSSKDTKVKKMNRTPKGTFYTRQNGQLTATVWKDSRVMMLLSTAHQGWRDPTTHTLRRKCTDETTGRLKAKTIPAPPQAVDYTKCMGGVDRGDQLRSYYTCGRKSQFWWRGILFFLIDVARVNAWLSFKHHHPSIDDDSSSDGDEDKQHDPPMTTKQMTHSQFVLDVAADLIDGFARGDTPRQAAGSRPVPADNARGHFSTKMPGRNARWCRWCRNRNIVTKSGKPKTTRRGCPVCGVNLCPGACFLQFHRATVPEDDSTTTTTDDE